MQRIPHPFGGYSSLPQQPGALLWASLALWGVAAALLALPGCPRTNTRPSVLIVIVDTLRADMVGALESSAGLASPTPFLDRWAKGAARFRRASTPAPFTMPAMAAVFTGAYPDRSGVVAHESGVGLGPWPGTTLAEAARNSRMTTAAVVANPWLARPTTGFDRGFDAFTRQHKRGEPTFGAATAVTDEAIRLLDATGNQPSLVWVHYFDPHMPYEPPTEFAVAAGAGSEPNPIMAEFRTRGRDLAAIYQGRGWSPAQIDQARKLYEGEVRYVDEQIGRLFAHLESSGRARNTVVVVASDHGESLGEHGLFFAHDFTVYEELTHVPLMVRGPGIASGARDEPVSLLDVAPTLCRLAGLDCTGTFDGCDLFQTAADSSACAASSRTLFAAGSAMRVKGTPFVGLEVPGLAGRWTMALQNRRKLIRTPTRSGEVLRLFDLHADPQEERDLATTDAQETQRLSQLLTTWLARMDAARPSIPTTRKRRADSKELRSLGYLQ